jgi:predicted nucleic acid-binding protein
VTALGDSSVLIAAFHPEHEHHQARIDAVVRHDTGEVSCAAYSFAEVYAGLTGMPVKWRVGGDEAMLYLQSLRERLTLISLNDDEYIRAMAERAALGLSGGAIYDAIIGECGLKSGAVTIYTWNLKHFLR